MSRLSQPINGQLFKYGDDPMRQMTVFVTGNKKRGFVVINGQTEGLLSLLFLSTLSEELLGADWTTVQVQLASSCVGYGGRTHVGDAEDLTDLIEILTEEFEMTEIVLYANGNGVQVALEYMAKSRNFDVVTRVILQGGVADPANPIYSAVGVSKRDEHTRRMVAEGRGEEVVSGDIYDLPTSAARLSTGGFPTLQEALWNPALAGDKDALTKLLQTVAVPVCLLISFPSDYVPGKEKEAYFTEMVQACAATPELEVNFFAETCDEKRVMLRGSEAIYTATVVYFLTEQDRRRSERDEAAKKGAAEEIRRSRSILAKSCFK